MSSVTLGVDLENLLVFNQSLNIFSSIKNSMFIFPVVIELCQVKILETQHQLKASNLNPQCLTCCKASLNVPKLLCQKNTAADSEGGQAGSFSRFG